MSTFRLFDGIPSLGKLKAKSMNGNIFITSGLSEGERIRLARLAGWLRQVDVASLAGVSLVEVTNAEKNRYVTPERKDRILKVVGLMDNDHQSE